MTTSYLLLFRNASAENGYSSTPQDMADDMPKWQSWIGEIASQGKLIHTAPITYEATVIQASGIQLQPHKEANSVLVSGFLICESNDIVTVQQWAQTCPILKYPHSSVEIRALIPFVNSTNTAI